MNLLPDAPLNQMAESLDALDRAAKHLTVASIAIGFPQSIHLIYAHLPNRAVTLGRLLFAGGTPLGLVGYTQTEAGMDPCYAVFPRVADPTQVRQHLWSLAKSLLCNPLRCYALLPGAPAVREPWSGTTKARRRPIGTCAMRPERLDATSRHDPAATTPLSRPRVETPGALGDSSGCGVEPAPHRRRCL